MPVEKHLLEELVERKSTTADGLVGLCSYAALFLLDEDLGRSESSATHRAVIIALVRCGQQMIKDHPEIASDNVILTLEAAIARIRQTRPEGFEEPKVEVPPDIVRPSRYERDPVI